MSERRRARSAVRIERSGLDGQRLDEPDDSLDCALSTFTLCTIPEVTAALAEVRRVLRPEGVFQVLEHGLAAEPEVARWQGRLEPVQKRIAGGCHLTRDIPALLEAAGFTVQDAESAYLPGPSISRPWGLLLLLALPGVSKIDHHDGDKCHQQSRVLPLQAKRDADRDTGDQ